MTCCVDQERADVCKSESPLKLRFQQSSFVCEARLSIHCADITLKKNNKSSSSQCSYRTSGGSLSCMCIIIIIVIFLFYFFFQENVILGSDYPFPLGEHHSGKLIEDVYKDDVELRVREQSHSVSRVFFATDRTPRSSLLKLPIVVIQKFCYHGNVTSHFSL